ncbi:hypothetical protein ACUN7V_16575 [Quadrisphaera oryzae]|uniref:hypothetical protein n=1 Tax=Quadrisphaera TaxID=317661 RepID=UPI001645BC0C|nr:hypothetical protein [Quadrisphaera sp. RL12-1S]MBC3760891.1 hypothetical protein [Quadrisphaera sp. RL12-1S]
MTSSTTSTPTSTGAGSTSFPDLFREMWSYLTGRGAAINYEFVDMAVEVPRETGPDAPRATWKLNGTLRITTSEDASRG